MDTPAARSPLLEVPGAVDSAGLDTGVPAHFGNPLGEQRALASGQALAEVSRGVVTVAGPDRLSWLDSLTSQRLTGLAPGEAAESLLLDPQGHVEHDLRVVDDGETTWLIVQREEAQALAAFLDRMRFLLRVEVADVTGTTAVVGGFEGSSVPLTALAVWTDPWRTGASGGAQYSHVERHPASEWTWTETVVRREDLASLADLARSGQVRLAGALAVEALRVAAWRPRLGADTDERTIPHELDWLRSAVHLSKGCYRGQETVAKVHNLGRPPRRLVLLHLDGSENVPVPAGAPVLDRATGKEVGAVTSPAVHHELGPIALAVVKRNLDAAAALVVDVEGVQVAAAQEVIVPADAGQAVDVPKLPRLGSAARR